MYPGCAPGPPKKTKPEVTPALKASTKLKIYLYYLVT
jgi:hypothetical protein